MHTSQNYMQSKKINYIVPVMELELHRKLNQDFCGCTCNSQSLLLHPAPPYHCMIFRPISPKGGQFGWHESRFVHCIAKRRRIEWQKIKGNGPQILSKSRKEMQ